MKFQKIKSFVVVLMLICLLIPPLTVFAVNSVNTEQALSEEQKYAIQTLISDAQRISRVPGISVSVVQGDETHFFSTGLANREVETSADEETLWELASVSKMFTALGLLYLEEQGLLSLNDSIADHLPWLTFRYNGQPLNMQEMRLYHFLYHTSGITQRHPNRVQDRPGPDTLQSTVEALIDAELTFFPGEKFDYGTKNYNVLGLVIAGVAGQSYESFMEERIFQPLGLTQTFANRDHAEATGQLAQGYVTNFVFWNTPVDSQESRGSVPTGYIISSTRDMARFMRIQLGLVTDIPEIFTSLIPKTHIGNQAVSAEYAWGLGYIYYAAGWMVHSDESRVEHSGGNPSFATHVLLLPEKHVGVTVLSNAPAINTVSVAENITNILEGNLGARYSMFIIQIVDIAASALIVLAGVLTFLFIRMGLRRKHRNIKHPITKKRIALIVVWAVITLIIGVLTALNLSIFLSHAVYSQLTGLIMLMLLSASITWFVTTPKRKKQPHNN